MKTHDLIQVLMGFDNPELEVVLEINGQPAQFTVQDARAENGKGVLVVTAE